MYTNEYEFDGLSGRKQRRRWQAAAALAAAAGIAMAYPKLKAFFKGQGMSEQEATAAAREITGKEAETPPVIVAPDPGPPAWILPMTIVTLAAGFFLSKLGK